MPRKFWFTAFPTRISFIIRDDEKDTFDSGISKKNLSAQCPFGSNPW